MESQEVPQPYQQPSMPQRPISSDIPINPSNPVNKIVLGITIIVVAVALLLGGYFLGTRANKQNAQIYPTNSAPTQALPSPTVTTTNTYEGWKTYTDATFGYSFQYPPTWTIKTSAVTGVTTTILTNPNNGTLTLTYGYRDLGVPPHVFKSTSVDVAGEKLVKTYNDGCNFNSDGTTAATGDCKNVTTQFYAITYGVPSALSNDPAAVDTTPGSKDYLWSTGSQSISLGMDNFHGKPATFQYFLNKPIAITDSSFQATDAIIDAIVASLKFSK